ncbi:hypothetical protein HanXRQr2_Chr11g0520101 [Helianthus annuus]|uniref:Uncharacterized protein n=1 Tax=Helianthus annuus TaxID=4232 RepID=A0A9K3N2D3_HELAN|nr:hypothetical protein HanXRQr2_Chr11g0520101 [Helianthus annuus]
MKTLRVIAGVLMKNHPILVMIMWVRHRMQQSMQILMNFWRKLQQKLKEDLFWWIKLLILRLLSIQPLWLMSTVHQVRLHARCADMEKSMSELQGKHDALQASLFDLQDKHTTVNENLSDLQSKHDALQEKYDVTFIHNQKLTVDLSKCTEANMFYENHEKEFKSVIETLKKDKTELTKMVSRKQTDINLYISRLESMQKEMACVKTESDAIQLKLDSYLSSSYVLDHIIDVQKEKRDVTCIGYKKCPPPVRHNYDAMPDEEDRVFFEPSVPLDVKEFAAGLGYQKEVSSDSDVSADTFVSAEQNQDPPVVIEDADSSDDESDDTVPAKSDAVVKNEDIPLENHILCDPPVKPAKTVATESSSEKESESVNLLYTLVEC